MRLSSILGGVMLSLMAGRALGQVEVPLDGIEEETGLAHEFSITFLTLLGPVIVDRPLFPHNDTFWEFSNGNVYLVTLVKEESDMDDFCFTEEEPFPIAPYISNCEVFMATLPHGNLFSLVNPPPLASGFFTGGGRRQRGWYVPFLVVTHARLLDGCYSQVLTNYRLLRERPGEPDVELVPTLPLPRFDGQLVPSASRRILRFDPLPMKHVATVMFDLPGIAEAPAGRAVLGLDINEGDTLTFEADFFTYSILDCDDNDAAEHFAYLVDWGIRIQQLVLHTENIGQAMIRDGSFASIFVHPSGLGLDQEFFEALGSPSGNTPPKGTLNANHPGFNGRGMKKK